MDEPSAITGSPGSSVVSATGRAPGPGAAAGTQGGARIRELAVPPGSCSPAPSPGSVGDRDDARRGSTRRYLIDSEPVEAKLEDVARSTSRSAVSQRFSHRPRPHSTGGEKADPSGPTWSRLQLTVSASATAIRCHGRCGRGCSGRCAWRSSRGGRSEHKPGALVNRVDGGGRAEGGAAVHSVAS